MSATNAPEEGQAFNLVTWVVSAEEVDGFVVDHAARLVQGPPIALAQTKGLLNEGADRTMREALANESRAQAVNFATDDAPEAYAAFAEKRPRRSQVAGQSRGVSRCVKR